MGNYLKQPKNGNINFFCRFNFCAVVIFFLLSETNFTKAQEYATDKLFMKQYKMTKCKNEAEKIIKKIKKRPEMTHPPCDKKNAALESRAPSWSV